MHNIRTDFNGLYGIYNVFFNQETDTKNNFYFYPVKPKMNDLKIVALCCCMEALGIDSENLLWSNLKTDYASLFPELIDRSRFNRRRKRLPFIGKLQDKVATCLQNLSGTMVVDSVPIPVVKMARARSFRAFKKDYQTAPAKGYSAVNKGWFIGYNLHVIIFDKGVVQQSGITKGNVHDINFLKELENLPERKKLLGDRAYISKTLQTDLFDGYKVRLKVPFRNNQYEYKKHPKRLKSKRQMIETFFAQMCDHLNLKHNYAKSYEGLAVRLASKAVFHVNFALD
jgi:hypothetical protein